MAALDQRVNIGVGVVVTKEINGETFWLLSERIGEKHGKGEWSFPGGKPEPGEHPAYAAARELYEETGLPPFGLYDMQMWTYDRYKDDAVHFVAVYFSVDAGDLVPERTEPEKHGPWEWLSADSIKDLHAQNRLFSGVAQVVGLDFP